MILFYTPNLHSQCTAAAGRRSGKRRGGEEGRTRGGPGHLKKKKNNSWDGFGFVTYMFVDGVGLRTEDYRLCEINIDSHSAPCVPTDDLSHYMQDRGGRCVTR